MKKSKVYFEELKEALESKNEESINKKIVSVFNDIFIKEIPEIIEMRRAESDSAMKAIFREQNQKWNSICNKCESIGCNVLKRDAIKNIVEKDVLHGEAL